MKISRANIGWSSGPGQPNGDAREDLKKALQNLHDVKSFRARTEANTMTLMEVEFVNPDRFHWKVQSSKEGPGGVIIVGKDAFINKGNGAWIKSPINISAMIQQVRDENVEEAMTRREEIKLAGRDVLDGALTLVYQYQYKPADKESRLWKMWISAIDWLPRKSESEAGASGGPKTTIRITYSDYNSNIRIEPPV